MKKFVTYAVVVATIAWSLGLASVTPASAAYAPVAGDYVKTATDSAVYYVGADLKRHLFSNLVTFRTWESASWSSLTASKKLVVVTQSEFDAMDSSANVTARPGVNLVKFDNSPRVYAVTPGAKLSLLDDATAKALYGTTYASKVVTIQSSFETNYTKDGVSLTTSSNLPNGSLVKYQGSEDVYMIQNGQKSLVTSDAFVANKLRSSAVMTIPSTMTYTTGASITAEVAAIANPVATATAGGSTTPVVGGLTVALAAATPASTNIASGTAFNPVLKVNLTAGNADVTVTALTLKKAGFVSNNNTVTGIDIIDNAGVRHGNMASSINADNEVVLLFGNTDAVKVPANSTVTLTVRINTGSAAISGTVQFGIASVAAITSNATIGGSFPIWGNSMSLINSNNTVGTVTASMKYVVGATATMNIDATSAQDITKINILTGSAEKVKVSSVTLYNNGNAADTDYKDVELVDSTGAVLATAQPKGNYVTFNLATPYAIDKGMNKDLTVRLKVVGTTDRTIDLVVYNNYDIVVTGNDTGASLIDTASGFPMGTGVNKVTIGKGTMTLAKSSDSPNAAVTPGTSNVVLAKYDVKASGENMELRKISLGLNQVTGLTGSVYVKVNGSSVYSETPTAGNHEVTLQSYYTLTAGQTAVVTVEANVASTATSSNSFVATFDVTSVKRLLTNDIIDPTVSAITANTINVQIGVLKVTTLSTPVAHTTVNVNDHELANIELNANNSGEAVKVSSIVMNDLMGGAGVATQVSNLRMQINGVTVETSNSTSNNAASTTYNFKTPIVVAKNTNVVVKLIGDITGSTSTATHTFSAYGVSAVGQDTGNTVDATKAGSGQAIALTTSGSLNIALVTGSTATPSNAQVKTVGTNDGTYFALTMTARNEALKLRTLKLTATGTALVMNDIRNIRVYVGSASQPILTANQMDSCSSNVCSVTFTSTDNLLASTIGTTDATAITLYVKADIGAKGIAQLGHDFAFRIASSTADIIAVGATSGNAASTVAGSAIGTGYTYIAPAIVTVDAVSPTTATQLSQAAGNTLGIFKITNTGTKAITLTGVKFVKDGGSNVATFGLAVSGDGQSSFNTDISTTSSSVDFGTNFSSSIQGGSYRYLTVKNATAASSTDAVTLSANSNIGDITYSIDEAVYGDDANGNGTQTEVITGLKVVGNPSTATVTLKN